MKIFKIAVLTVFIFALAAPVFSQTQEEYEKLLAENEQLKKEVERLTKDRDNLRTQAKFLLEYKKQITEAQETLASIGRERDQWEFEKQTLVATNKKLQNEIKLLQTRIEDINIMQMQLEQERDSIKKTLSKSKAGYIIIDDFKRQISEEKRENSRLNKTIEKLQGNVEKLRDDLVKMETIAEVKESQVAELKSKYNNALATNKTLEKKLQQLPKEYAEVARENKVLQKRTALMHYNLGVFYTKNKEYPRAIAEFEKTIELNPEDAAAYFNLGYIYAEYLEDRGKAIDNFTKYLKLAKKEDKDIDWVKRYILTWQTWEGKDKAR